MCSQEPEPGSDGFSAALKLTAVFGNRIEKNTEICKNKFWFQDLNGLFLLLRKTQSYYSL